MGTCITSSASSLLLMLGLLTSLEVKITKAEDVNASGGMTWEKLKELATDIANNGVEKGEECDGKATRHAMRAMRFFGEYSMEKLATFGMDAEFESDLDPSKKSIVCAVNKGGLYCAYDEKDNFDKCMTCDEIKSDNHGARELCSYSVPLIIKGLGASR